MRITLIHGGLGSKWADLEFPSKKEVQFLQEAAKPLITTSRLDNSDNNIRLDLTLTKNEVTVIEMHTIQDETESYEGLDDNY